MDLKKIINGIKTFEEFKIAKSNFFSKNQEIIDLRKDLESSSNKNKAEIGKKINIILNNGIEAFNKKQIELENEILQRKIDSENIDITQTVKSIAGLTPITKIINRLTTWFLQNGYFEEITSEIETDEMNFQRLNIPQNHPARDMQDSLYIDSKTLLKTHNTCGSIRSMLKMAPNPFASFTIGNVFRKDDEDETHSHQFTQCDFVFIGDVTMPNLIWTLESLMSFVFEEKVKIRLRPSYFPFTEPSCEIDIWYQNKWVEVLGAGMLHRNVLSMNGYNPKKVRGFAGGIGIERLAMIKYGIKDIRDFYVNDLRFNRQFKGIS